VRQIEQLRLLKLVSEEVNRTRNSRLNCWKRESLRTTGSKRDSKFRKKVIKHYQRENSTGESVKCQILDEYVLHDTAKNTIIAAHIWKVETKGKFLDEFGLCKEDVNNVRNGMFLTKGIEEAFDNQQVCFLYNTLNKELCLWVADTTILSDKIEGSNPQKTFADVHQKPLRCPDEDHMPFRRLLAWHARLTLELRKESVQVPNYTSEYDLSPGRAGATLDPIAQKSN
jgi:HNH endonuclease